MFEAPTITVDPDQLNEEAFARYAEMFPGVELAEGNIETRLIRIINTVIGGPLATLLVAELARIFGRFGEVVFAIQPLVAAAATSEVTFTMVDNAGYTIPAGTEIAVPTSGNTSVGFHTVAEASVPNGSTSVANVVVEAVIAGTAANEITDDAGDPTLVQADELALVVESITWEADSSGGVNAETPDEYLDRLSGRLTLLSDNAVLPSDVEVLALDIASVARATALDTYDADTATYDNEKTVTVAVVAVDGTALSGGVKDAVEAWLAEHREEGFLFFAIDPTFHAVKVDVDVVARAGADPTGVDAAVTQAITAYLDPANWGIPGQNEDEPGGWKNQTVVRRTDLITLVENVESVDHISGNLQLALEADSLGTTDVTLTGPAPLTQAGTITVDVV